MTMMNPLYGVQADPGMLRALAQAAAQQQMGSLARANQYMTSGTSQVAQGRVAAAERALQAKQAQQAMLQRVFQQGMQQATRTLQAGLEMKAQQEEAGRGRTAASERLERQIEADARARQEGFAHERELTQLKSQLAQKGGQERPPSSAELSNNLLTAQRPEELLPGNQPLWRMYEQDNPTKSFADFQNVVGAGYYPLSAGERRDQAEKLTPTGRRMFEKLDALEQAVRDAEPETQDTQRAVLKQYILENYERVDPELQEQFRAAMEVTVGERFAPAYRTHKAAQRVATEQATKAQPRLIAPRGPEVAQALRAMQRVARQQQAEVLARIGAGLPALNVYAGRGVNGLLTMSSANQLARYPLPASTTQPVTTQPAKPALTPLEQLLMLTDRGY